MLFSTENTRKGIKYRISFELKQIKIRDSKYGHALVIQTLDTAGGYTLGFRVDPAARLVDVYKELDSLFSVYAATPIFGVTYERREVDKTICSMSNAHSDLIHGSNVFDAIFCSYLESRDSLNIIISMKFLKNRKHPSVMMTLFQLTKSLKSTNPKPMKSTRNSLHI